MNKEKFIDCLRDPSLLQDNDIQELNQLVKRYPYFQGARALLAKVSKERNLKDAAHRISSAAVYTTDRALLKKYISDHLFFLDSREAIKEEKKKPAKAPAANTPRPPVQSREAVKQAPPKPDTPRPKPSGEAKPPEAQKPVRKQPRPSAETPQKPSASEKLHSPKEQPATKPPVTKKVPEKPAPVAEDELTDLQASPSNLDDWIKEIHEDIEELKKSKARFLELDKKLEEEEKKKEAEQEEEDAVNAALKKVTSNKNPTAKKKPAKAESETKDSKSKPAKKATTASKASKEKPPVAETTEPEGKEKKPKATKAKASPKKRTSTKKAPSKPDPVTEESPKEGQPPVAAKAEEKEPVAKKAPAKKKEPKVEEDTSTLKVVRRRSGKVQSTTFESVEKEKPEEENKDKIIDEFISTSPKISKADKSKLASEEDKEDLSDKSSRFQADIGTEYLAEIYVEQGKIDRAISIYEKLSLKFPEKKSYFVARIEELKSK